MMNQYMPSDEEIMGRVAMGELHHLSILFERYKRPLYCYFLKSTHDESLSKDLLQIVFEKIIKYKKAYKNDNCFKSWVFKISSNCLMDHYRKEKSLSNRHQQHSKNNDSFYDPFDRMEMDEKTRLLHCALDKLRPDFREILWLTRFEKMKYKDIAQMKGLSESAIKIKVHRAIKELKDIYIKMERS